MFKTKTIGIDIDDIQQGKELLRILRVLKMKGLFRRSASRKGYHFSIKVKECNKKEQLIIRYIFGDCYGRWLGDFRRMNGGVKHFNILFDKKKGRKAGRWFKI